MTIVFYEGPLDGQKREGPPGMPDVTAHHIGDGSYVLRDEDGNEIGGVRFAEQIIPVAPPPELAKLSERRFRVRLEALGMFLSTVIVLGAETLSNAFLGRALIGLAWGMLMGLLLRRR